MKKSPKKTIELINYYFERVDVRLPAFPHKGGKLSAWKASGNHISYRHKNKKQLAAYKWMLSIVPSSKKDVKNFSAHITITGLFKINDPLIQRKTRNRLMERTLLNVVKLNLDKVYFHSILKNGVFPPVVIPNK